MKKLLIVYYSWSNGNTKKIAEQLQAATKADIVRIDTVQPYPKDFQKTVDQGQREVDQGYMPQIQPISKSFADYDAIAIGTPTWWYTMAPAVLSFIHECNAAGSLSNKTVIPFSTNGGWPGHAIKDISHSIVGAETVLPMEVQFDSNGGDYMITSQNTVDNWITSVKKFLAE